MSKKVCAIYQIKNLINNKIYIGSSVDVVDRWREHKRSLKKSSHHSTHLQRSWNKYGEKNFEFSLIEIVDNQQQLLEKE